MHIMLSRYFFSFPKLLYLSGSYHFIYFLNGGREGEGQDDNLREKVRLNNFKKAVPNTEWIIKRQDRVYNKKYIFILATPPPKNHFSLSQMEAPLYRIVRYIYLFRQCVPILDFSCGYRLINQNPMTMDWSLAWSNSSKLHQSIFWDTQNVVHWSEYFHVPCQISGLWFVLP